MSDASPPTSSAASSIAPVPGGITLYGAAWCPDCRRAKEFFAEHRVDFHYVDLELHPDAVAEVEARNGGKRIIPTIVFPDGGHLAEPGNDELAARLGLPREAVMDTYDVIILGGGPTGLTTSIYTARESMRTLVVEKSALGGQAGVTDRLDNYPGFPEGIKGADLARRFAEQARRYEVELLQAVAATGLRTDGSMVTITTATAQTLQAAAVVVATGSSYRRTGAPGEADLIGAGVHFCATCDGPFYRGAAELVVVGGGNSGLEEGLFLTQFAEHVTVVERGSSLRGSRLLQDKVTNHPKMSVLLDTGVAEFTASEDGHLASVTLQGPSGAAVHPAAGAFIFIGLDPTTGWLDGVVDLDPAGFIVTDRMFSTSLPGVFAAGDVRAGSTKQLAAAVGEGAAVALQVRHHLDDLRDAVDGAPVPA